MLLFVAATRMLLFFAVFVTMATFRAGTLVVLRRTLFVISMTVAVFIFVLTGRFVMAARGLFLLIGGHRMAIAISHAIHPLITIHQFLLLILLL
jgi:hypothetical protein